MQFKNILKFFLGLNKDFDPSLLETGEFTDGLNVRVASSSQQQGVGPAETLQSEIEILIDVSAEIYYGEAIGGSFQYAGYSEVTIGTQTWLKRNWDFNYPGSKVYNNDESNRAIYGGLYTWDQAMAADFCPPGWHMPTEAEVNTLLAYLGGELIAGGKLKEPGVSHWNTPNTGADDSSGFKGLPGGKFDALFSLLGEQGLFWIAGEGYPWAPVALPATDITSLTFLANWEASDGADGYYLDVPIDAAFTSFVAGYNNKDVGNVLHDTVSGLIPSIPYYYRVRAYNDIDTSINSNVITVSTTAVVFPLLDKDANVYTTIIIGNQEWIIENFKVTKYADGVAIPNITVNANWIADVVGAYCWYDNDITNKTPYGALYNWHAVNNAHELAYLERNGVQEAGWRVATYNDFVVLANALGGFGVSGGKLKEAGLTHWITPNTGATNESGFTALPTGDRVHTTGVFAWSQYGWIWSATEFDVDQSYYIFLDYNSAFMQLVDNGYKTTGFAVRLVRSTGLYLYDDTLLEDDTYLE